MTEAIGWASSLILLVTIVNQVRKQWASGTSEGVSRWLYVGQVAASVGFTVYSWLVRNWVFVVTNSLLLCSAVLGLVIVLRHKRSPDSRQAARERGALSADPHPAEVG